VVTNDVCYKWCKILMQTDLFYRLHEIDKISSLEMCTIYYKIYRNLSFLCILEYKVVYIEILHHCSIHHWLSLEF
jgi:hypothetical protein